jgi:hypothetical protein
MYGEDAGVLVNPSLENGELSVLWYFELVFEFDEFGVCFIGFVDAFWSDLAAMGYSSDLTFELQYLNKVHNASIDLGRLDIR